VKQRIASGFERFGRTIYRNRLKTLAVLLVIIGALVSQLPKVAFDTSTESFFRHDDPALVDYEAFQQQFGRDELVVIAIDPPAVFERAFLEKLRTFHEALESEVPHLKEVTSLLNVRDTRGEGDELIVEDLLRELPATPQAMAALERRVLASRLYPNLLISEDGRFTTIVLETQAFTAKDAGGDLLAGFGSDSLPGGETADAPAALTPLSDEENSEVVRAVETLAERFEAPDFPIHIAGSPLVTDFLKRAMQQNMARFIALATLAIGVFLLVLFRRFSGVLLPLLVVLLSLVSTVGAMAALGVAFKLPLMVLPSFLLAVGVGAVVHLLAIFFRNFEQEGNKEDAIAHALGHSGLPIVMTSLTTAAGLLSFATAVLASVADLGIFAGLGVMIALVYTLVLVPALLSLLPLRRHARFTRPGGSGWADRILRRVGLYSTRHAGAVAIVTVLVTAVAGAGLPLLRFSHNTLTWFPQSTEIRRSTDLIDRELKGSISVEMVIDTREENGLYDPQTLTDLERLAAFAEQYRDGAGQPFVGKTNSVADVLKEIHQALNENRPEFYRIPLDRELIAQELLLFENSGNDDLERLVDSQFSQARLSAKTPWRDAAAYVTFVAAMQREGERLFGERAQVTTTGLLKLFTQSIYALMESMVTSYTVAIVVITLLMIVLIGRLGLGLLSMIPNLLPIVITLGLMGWLDIPLDAFTLLIGSIALGLAVDDTIHFFHHFLRYYGENRNVTAAVEETLLSAGRAMLFTSMVLITGFWLFMFASLNNLFYFGLLTGIALSVALLADLVLAPAMMELLARVRLLRGAEPEG
jgi:predicted RND superfamily exporter protein